MIYLDHAATTPVPRPVAEAMYQVLTEQFGNPSSQYPLGREAKALVEEGRAVVAGALGCRPENLHFTSCGTESDNWAISAAVWQGRHTGRHIITTAVEHSAVLEPCKLLQQQGYEVTYLAPDKTGHVTAEQVAQALREDTVLVSMMLVNNETGCIFPVQEVARLLREKNSRALLHCDAVQGFLKVPFTAASLGADLITVSGHKIHAPKGVGALYIKPALVRSHAISPYLIGGGQEAGLRSGTENMVGICGFGAAATRGAAAFAADTAHMQALRDRLESALTGTEVRVNRPAGAAAPHILNLTLPDIKSQTMLNYLSEQGICVSSGSACSAHGGKTSPSLLSFGLSPHEADCSLRVSFSARNTAEDVDALVAALSAGVSRLVRMRGKR